MKLHYRKDKEREYSFYLDENGRMTLHGPHIWYFADESPNETYFYYHGSLHGEYKHYNRHGHLEEHHFYINGETHPYVEMNEQEKLLFQIQHPGFRFIED